LFRGLDFSLPNTTILPPGVRENKVNINVEMEMLADMRDKALRDEQSRLKGAEEEGANKKAISIARKMLKKGKSIEEVVDLTELSIEEIEELIGK